MSLIKYDHYKDSGVDWLGEIPNNWKIIRLKDVIKSFIDTEHKTVPFYPDGEYLVVRTSNIKEGKLTLNKAKFTNKEGYKEWTRRGKPDFLDIIITREAPVGEAFVVNDKLNLCLGQRTVLLKPIHSKIISQCVVFNFYSNTLKGFLKINSNGSTVSHLNMREIPNIFIPVPNSFHQQKNIANYLDQQTQIIDKKIKLLEAKIDHYQALKKSLINETVCRGLDKTVALKDSGIEWIGAIPEHWKVKRLKDNFKLFTGNSISDKSLFEISTNAIPYVSTKDLNISTGKLNYNNGIYIPNENKKFRRTPSNSVLICLEGANAGKKIGFSNQTISFVNKLCAIKSINNNTFDKYLYYFCQSSFFKNQFFELLSGLIGGVSISLLKNLNSITPPIEEQQQIAKYLDEKTGIIDQIIANIQSQVERLKELRQSLINEVVTGKVRVPEMEHVK